MSVQTGILSFDGRPINQPIIDYLFFDLELRGPDYYATYVENSVGIGIRGLLLTPEDCDDQPVRGSRGSVLTFDGRLDNRGELATRLGIHGASTISDAKLVLTAYETFGETCFELLSGEFACVIWDGRLQFLFLVRSFCGTCPLFYYAQKTSLTWSSELDHLVIKEQVEPVVNEEYALGFIYYMPDIDQSPFLNVEVIAPGTYVRVRPNGEIGKPVPIWCPTRISTLVLQSDQEYEEAWRHYVQCAIADRLRAKDPVWCELSGGLDSSTVFAMADRLLQESGHDSNWLTSVSFTYETSRDCDESFFIALLEAQRGVTGIHLSEVDQAMTVGLRDVNFSGFPSTVHLSKTYSIIAQLMRQKGSRVLLSGTGGDELFCSGTKGSPEIADLLSEWRFVSALRSARQWSQFSGMSVWSVLMTEGISPLTIGMPMLEWKPADIQQLCTWATPRAQKWLNRRGHRLGLKVETNIGLPSRQVRLFSVRTYRALLATGWFRAAEGIHVSHPFAHQRLIEFILSLPMQQLTKPGQDRWLHRRAVRGLLPERIRCRRSKGVTDEALCRALIRERNVLDERPWLVCERGYADLEAVNRSVEEMSIGRVRQICSFIHLLSAERWLRSFETISSRRLELRRRFDCSPHFGSSEFRHSLSVAG